MNEVDITVTSHDRTRPGFDSAERGAKSMSDRIGKALSGLKTIAMAAAADMASSLAGPLVAAAGTGVAAFAASGAAIGAFGLAVVPQLSAVSKASQLYTAAMDAQSKGSADAAKKMDAYKQAISHLPPATRDTAIALAGAKKSLKDWSDSLAPATMPIFTRGLNLVSAILPKLTTLVRIGAASLDDFMASIERGVTGGGLDGFMTKLNKAAADSLPRLLGAVKNVGVGLAGIVAAFLPFAGSMAGGIEKLTAKFAAWGRSLGSNPAFTAWMRDMQARGPVILGLLGNLAKIIFNVAEALAPFTGLTLAVTAALAKFVAAIPQGVMDWLAPTITGIVLAIRAWAVVQGVLNLALAANPIGLVVIAVAALAAALIYAYKHSERFRAIVQGAFNAVREAVSGLKDKAGPIVKSIAQWFTDTLPAAFDEGVGELLNIVGKVDDAVRQVRDKLSGLSSGAGIGGGGRKKGGLIDLIAPELAHPEEFINFFKNTIRKITAVLKDFAGDWRAKLHLDGLGSVKDIAGRAKDAAFDFAHRAYRALLNASFPGSSIVKGAVRAAVDYARRTYRAALTANFPGASVVRSAVSAARRFASGRYQATLRAFDAASRVARSVIGWLRSIPRTVDVWIRAHIPDLPWPFATGGISHAAEGGPRSNLALVGERGPELVKLPFGSTVYPTGQSQQMLAQGGGGGMGELHIHLGIGGHEFAEIIIDPLRNAVRTRGGNVQAVLGR